MAGHGSLIPKPDAYETYRFVGMRIDMLRRAGTAEEGDWRVARRESILEKNVLLAKNLIAFI
ncbi:MAG: hypothetical protein FJY55_06665 [Betaproteobacteria bacterium]|nr:hypothetical protein [Betaproteobacteria bacterium]